MYGIHKNSFSLNNIRDWTGRSGTAEGTNAYTLTVTPPINSYEPFLTILVKFTNANTLSSTININNIGVVDLCKRGNTPLDSGDILEDEIYFIVYNGGRFQLVSVGGGSGAVGSQTLLSQLTTTNSYRPVRDYYNSFLSATGYGGIEVYQRLIPAVDFTATSLSLICTTAFAGGTARIALYTESAGMPSTLISGTDTGNLDCSTTGFKEGAITPTQLLANTNYWVWYAASSGSIGFRNSSEGPMNIFNPSDFLYYSSIRRARAYSAPPATAPTSGFTYAFANSAYDLVIYLKVQ